MSTVDAIPTRKPLGIFWDNSNIAFTRRELIPKFESTRRHSDLRIHFLNMFDFARFGRVVDAFVMVGSLPPENDPLWRRVMDIRAHVKGPFDLIKLRRDTNNKEQGVDDTLRAELFRFCISHCKNPGKVVLLTGDGTGYARGKGFFDAMEQVVEQLQWGAELCAWDCSCHGEMKKWAQSNHQTKYRNLELVYNQVTFIEGGRKATPLAQQLQSISATAPSPPATS